MAKLFYTLEEVCEKLGRSEDDVKEMARSGQLQEFRDRDRLMFKVEQIDLLAGADEESSEVHLELEDTSGGSAMELQGSGLDLQDSAIGLEESREGTGISVFDTDHGTEEAIGDQTHAGEALEEEELSLESVGSGSGLLDLTRESDDTSLGAELLEEVYSGDEHIEIPASASGLFEAAGAESPGDHVASAPEMAGAAVPMVLEAYDGGGSGLGIGLMIGALAALVCVAIIVIVGIAGATPALAMKMTDGANSLYIWGGALLGGTILLGFIGLLIGKASE
jgi:hypothetical protein